jgi:hypothetical protein
MLGGTTIVTVWQKPTSNIRFLARRIGEVGGLWVDIGEQRTKPACVDRSGRATVVGLDESSSLDRSVGVDPVTVAVDHHVMMKPTQGGEVVGVV